MLHPLHSAPRSTAILRQGFGWKSSDVLGHQGMCERPGRLGGALTAYGGGCLCGELLHFHQQQKLCSHQLLSLPRAASPCTEETQGLLKAQGHLPKVDGSLQVQQLVFDLCGQAGPGTRGIGGTKNALRSSGGADFRHRSCRRAYTGVDKRESHRTDPFSTKASLHLGCSGACTHCGQDPQFHPTCGGHTPVGVRAVNSGSKWKVSSGLPTAGLKGGLISFLYSFCGESGRGRGWGAPPAFSKNPGGSVQPEPPPWFSTSDTPCSLAGTHLCTCVQSRALPLSAHWEAPPIRVEPSLSPPLGGPTHIPGPWKSLM